MRPRIYLSGPMSNGGTLSEPEREENARYAIEFSMVLIAKGFSVLVPQYTEFAAKITGRSLSYGDWLVNDFAWIAVSDALYRLPGDSAGADAECQLADTHGVPVFRDVLTMDGHFRARGMLP